MKRRKPIRQLSKNLIPKLKRELDPIWSEIIKLRDRQCAVCGSTHALNAHHCIVPKKRSLAIRWELSNGIALCSGCHIKVHHCHKAQLDEYMRILNRRISTEDQQELEAKARAGWKPHVFELEERKVELLKVLNEARGEQ